MKLRHALWLAAASFLVWIGEAAGADGSGAWIAVRKPGEGAGISVGIVARLNANVADNGYLLEVKGSRYTGTLSRAHPMGIGPIAYAVVDLPDAIASDPFTATVAGIPQRSAQ